MPATTRERRISCDRIAGTRVAFSGCTTDFRAHDRKEISILPEVSQSSAEQDLRSPAAVHAGSLRSELGGNNDLIRLVERVTQTRLPWVVIPGSAITRWKMDDPAGWEKVSEWLAVHGVAIVRI